MNLDLDLLRHPGSEVSSLGGVVPSDVLLQHSAEKQVPDLEDLALGGVVQARDEQVAEDPLGQADDGATSPELGDLGEEFFFCLRRQQGSRSHRQKKKTETLLPSRTFHNFMASQSGDQHF